jgi:hypothetical protein
MTKERKAAIEQWQRVLEQLLRIRDNPNIYLSRYIYKKDMGYGWLANCWFCTYIRKKEEGSQGCERCPLSKYDVAKGLLYSYYCGGCGCTGSWSLYGRVIDIDNDINDRIAACQLIISALKGKHIWTYCTEVQ